MSIKKLRTSLEYLKNAENIKIIRIGTRVPFTSKESMTAC